MEGGAENFCPPEFEPRLCFQSKNKRPSTSDGKKPRDIWGFAASALRRLEIALPVASHRADWVVTKVVAGCADATFAHDRLPAGQMAFRYA